MEEKVKYKKGERWRSFTTQEKIILIITTIFLLYKLIRTYLPIYFAIINSFKSLEEYRQSGLAFPTKFAWENYSMALNMEYNSTKLPRMMYNTVIFTVTYLLAAQIPHFCVAYVIAKFKFPGRRLLYGIIMARSLVPIYGSANASFILVNNLGIFDNLYLMWITAFDGLSYSALITATFFETTASEYMESAAIDGAGNVRTFIQIMTPLILPIVLMNMLGSVIAYWNEYQTALIFMPSYPTLATGLYGIERNMSYNKGGKVVYFAGCVLSIIPPAIFFSACQKVLMDFSVDGGIKG